jgi:uncharacterized repeat protein (TIGR01451 family)
MKKHLLLCLLGTALNFSGTAQYVTIPTAFASFIRTYVSATAINGSQLDTTNTVILTTVDMTVNGNTGVTDITGIKYFKGLQNLVVTPSITSFPQLPAGLRSFESDNSTAFNFSTSLPDTLVALKLYNSYITSLPTLPNTLNILILNNCPNINSIPALPSSVTYLVATTCGTLNTVPALPTGLLHLDLSYSPHVSPLPAFSPELLYLNLSQSSYSPTSFQASLDTFICAHCSNITNLPDLNPAMAFLDVNHCNIVNIGTAPTTMLDYILSANPITTISHLPDTLLEYLRLDSMPNLSGISADSVYVGFGFSMNVCPNVASGTGGWMPNIMQNVRMVNNNQNYNGAISIFANNDNITWFNSFEAYIDSLDLSYNPLTNLPNQGYMNPYYTGGCNTCCCFRSTDFNVSHCQLNALYTNFFNYSYYSASNIDASYNPLGSVGEVPIVSNQLLMNNCQITDFQNGITINAEYVDLTNNPQLACMPFLYNVYNLYTNGDAVNCVANIPEANFVSDMGLTVCQAGNSNGCPLSPQTGGIVFSDTNQDGLLDFGEVALPGFYVSMNPGGFYRLSDNTGHYTFECQLGTYYTVTGLATLPYRHLTTSPFGVSYTGFATDTFHNIGIYQQPDVNDMEMFLTSMEQPRPGFHHDYFLVAWNEGTTVENGQIVMYFDPSLLYQSSSPAGAVSGNRITWNVANLPPTAEFTATVDFIVPVPVPLGSTISAGAYALCNTPDTTPLNNHDTITEIAIGSYDPNNKSVSPTNGLSVQQIAAGNYLTYTVRFQNTGTASAINIEVDDPLSASLDLNSFQFIAASNTYTWKIDGAMLKVYFNNINLPDSGHNEAGSHGFFTFRIKPLAGATPGQQIQNTASIYFDFNPAVVTNTAVSNISTFFTSQPQSQGLCAGEPLLLTVGDFENVV